MPFDAPAPIGIRANNPGNLEYNERDAWQGLAEIPYLTNDNGSIRYFNFREPVYGIRALARALIRAQDFLHLNTIAQQIERWAPAAAGNPTRQYTLFVAEKVGCSPDQPLNLHEFEPLSKLVTAIIRFEQGQQPYTEAQITKACILAGVEPKAPISSPVIQGTRIASAGATAQVGIQALQSTIANAGDTARELSLYTHYAAWAALALTILGVSISAYVYWDEQRKGVRP